MFLALSQGGTDMHCVVNQQTLIQDILTPLRASSTFESPLNASDKIIDYSLIKNQRLYLLYSTSIVVVDITALVRGRSSDSQAHFIEVIPLPEKCSRIEAVALKDGSEHLVIVVKSKAQIIHIRPKSNTSIPPSALN